jgi:glutathione synthase/RimK-type ligase-like ATP-grasp enzyme
LPELAILYEHPNWFEPLFAALDRRGLDYEKIRIQDHTFDIAGSPPPAPVVFSRLAMSSFLRDAEHALFYAQALYAHWEAQGARVLNGSRPLPIDISKARQLSLIRSLGLKTPETRVVHRFADLPAAARGLRWPVLVKADVGGSGAGISRYDTPDELAAAAAERTAPMGVNGVTLVQEYAPRRGGRITRIEVLDGRMLYAIEVESPGESFDLCPADFCMIQPGKEKIRMTRTQPPPEAVEAAEAIVRAGGFDIAGVEYLIDDRDGQMLFYDINGLSNFVADPMNILGYDPHEALVDYLEAQIARRKEAA